MLIFEKSREGRVAASQLPSPDLLDRDSIDLPKNLIRKNKPVLPEMSELDVVRHFTNLSQKNFCIDSQFYPLGSCTMKYNPRGVHKQASQDSFISRHPLSTTHSSQGFLSCVYNLQEIIKEITGMTGVSLTPMAGAQGELAGVMMIKAYHHKNKDFNRTEFLVPDAAHGTNPASAVKCGFTIKEIPTANNGDVDLEALEQLLGPNTAGIMLTNPSTLGVFDRNIIKIAELVHKAGGLLYYDGANLNAILGKVRPGDMGFDVMHLNCHKTFATPHGGGGPGCGPVAVGDKLKPYLPTPIVIKTKNNYAWADKNNYPDSIGRLSTFMGNAGIILRAYFYLRLLGREGVKRVGEIATLNANYLMKKLEKIGYTLAYPDRLATHEFIISLKPEYKKHGVRAMDVAKRLLDYGFHSPTTYFPLLISECLLIEPTETESKQTLDNFIDAMAEIYDDIQHNPEKIKTAPHSMSIKRVNDLVAARELNLIWEAKSEAGKKPELLIQA